MEKREQPVYLTRLNGIKGEIDGDEEEYDNGQEEK